MSISELYMSDEERERLHQKRGRDRLPPTYRWVKVKEGEMVELYEDEYGGLSSDAKLRERWEGPVWEIQRPLPTPANPNAYEAVGRIESTYPGGFRYGCTMYINLFAPGRTFHSYDDLWETGQQVIRRYEQALTERVGAQVELALEEAEL